MVDSLVPQIIVTLIATDWRFLFTSCRGKIRM